jgi:hypothetical protein
MMEGVLKKDGTFYKTSPTHRNGSKKWHPSNNSTIENLNRQLNDLLPEDKQMIEERVTQVAGQSRPGQAASACNREDPVSPSAHVDPHLRSLD